MFDNLNSLLLDIFEESRLSGETYSSRIQEIETVCGLDLIFGTTLHSTYPPMYYKMIYEYFYISLFHTFRNSSTGARIHASSSSAQSRRTCLWWPNNVKSFFDNHGKL